MEHAKGTPRAHACTQGDLVRRLRTICWFLLFVDRAGTGEPFGGITCGFCVDVSRIHSPTIAEERFGAWF